MKRSTDDLIEVTLEEALGLRDLGVEEIYLSTVATGAGLFKVLPPFCLENYQHPERRYYVPRLGD